MEVRATSKFVRISPSKVRDIARELKGVGAADAVAVLQFSHRKGASLLLKTLKSAIANAENNMNLSAGDLKVMEAVVQEGPSLRRFRPRARGSASRIKKRMSHLLIVLTDGET